jgi:hypothetical protein
MLCNLMLLTYEAVGMANDKAIKPSTPPNERRVLNMLNGMIRAQA